METTEAPVVAAGVAEMTEHKYAGRRTAPRIFINFCVFRSLPAYGILSFWIGGDVSIVNVPLLFVLYMNEGHLHSLPPG